MTTTSPLTLTETLERATRYFAAEPAAVSLVAEIQADATYPVEFAAIRRGATEAELVTVERTEAAAQAALDAHIHTLVRCASCGERHCACLSCEATAAYMAADAELMGAI